MKYPVIFGDLPVTILCIGAFIFGGVTNVRVALKAIRLGVLGTTIGKVERQQSPLLFNLIIGIVSFSALFFLMLAALVVYITVSRALAG